MILLLCLATAAVHAVINPCGPTIVVCNAPGQNATCRQDGECERDHGVLGCYIETRNNVNPASLCSLTGTTTCTHEGQDCTCDECYCNTGNTYHPCVPATTTTTSVSSSLCLCVCVSSLMFCISCSDEDGDDDDEERTHNTVDHRDIDSGADDNHCDEHLDSGANICADRCADASAHASRHDDDDDCASDARTNAAAVRRLVPRDVVFLRYRRRSVIGEPTTAAMRQHQRR